ncbi:uncharacterized protein LOC133316490 [Gastrolobium bilobum]|uniref:uncharacterized protein LOC133316490 n=1 Tax=Gastrolobium bilobum TaxID=150636 RepID=UPI002AB13001|nr:uncharacterized protein LOC133316490 [Gastrolobium bilobum]
MGKKISNRFLMAQLTKLWCLTVKFDIIDLDNGYVLVNFYDEKDYFHVLHEGPWIVVQHYVIVQRWRPMFDPYEEQFKRIAVWLRIPGLPLEFYTSQHLWRIGNLFGKTLKVDKISLRQSDAGGGEYIEKGKYARICVEVDLRRSLVSQFQVLDKTLQPPEPAATSARVPPQQQAYGQPQRKNTTNEIIEGSSKSRFAVLTGSVEQEEPCMQQPGKQIDTGTKELTSPSETKEIRGKKHTSGKTNHNSRSGPKGRMKVTHQNGQKGNTTKVQPGKPSTHWVEKGKGPHVSAMELVPITKEHKSDVVETEREVQKMTNNEDKKQQEQEIISFMRYMPKEQDLADLDRAIACMQTGTRKPPSLDYHRAEASNQRNLAMRVQVLTDPVVIVP